jgi:acyl-CoA synthetase (AMP-forming)/AMP-acid ligase II
VIQGYGIIELGLPILNKGDADANPEWVGSCARGFHAIILNERLEELPPGRIGELALYGPGMLDAYLYPFRRREEILVNGWFLTGDLALMNEQGKVKIEGRKKSMINVGGNKVFPEEVESVLNEHPAVADCRVKGARHDLLGETVLAEVVLNKIAVRPSEEELRSFCRKHLSTYKVPHKVVFIDSIPITPSGKQKR